jgi:hypothetical protein
LALTKVAFLFSSKKVILIPLGNSEKGKSWFVKSLLRGAVKTALTFEESV